MLIYLFTLFLIVVVLLLLLLLLLSLLLVDNYTKTVSIYHKNIRRENTAKSQASKWSWKLLLEDIADGNLSWPRGETHTTVKCTRQWNTQQQCCQNIYNIYFNSI